VEKPRELESNSFQRRYVVRAFLTIGSAVLALVASAFAQDPLTTLPDNYKLVFDNPALAIIHVHYEPHEQVPVHDHSKFATVYVYLSDSGPVRFSHVEEHPFQNTRAPLKLGAYRVSPGRIERHSVENQGDISTDFLRVEMKQVPVRHFSQEFRSPGAANPSQNSDAVEFSNADLATERIICVTGSCPVKASESPSVLIAFSGAQVIGSSTKRADATLKLGSIRWVPAGESFSIKPDPGATAHLLRILLPSSKVAGNAGL
jgi:predicted metal-dependent enzyme (double-stranded beta helix superfamily)